MSSLSSTNTNILCSNSTYLGNSFVEFNKGVVTYEKLYSIYKENGCDLGNNDEKNIRFSLATTDTINGSIPNISDNCLNTRRYLITNGNVIQTAAGKWTTNIAETRDPYIQNQGILADKYINLTNTRYQLDQDVQKLLGVDTSLYEKQNILDSAVFTTLLWTVLATSVLYYTFIKI